MKVQIVIGAGYGDEGKGMTTDWLCHESQSRGEKPLVIRANGGTQAAHTVQTPEGDRHVFSHHGSGTLLGVPTFLGPDFIVNAIGFRQESEKLAVVHNVTPVVYVHPMAEVSIPADMMINQYLEESRGDSRHGSCGWGIGETMRRTTSGEDRRLNYGMLARWRAESKFGLKELHDFTVKCLGGRFLPEEWHNLPTEWRERMINEKIMGRWLEDLDYLLARTESATPVTLFGNGDYDTLIFEGAQGLGLDENGEHFPHVTWSRTGSINPMKIVLEGGLVPQSVETYYITRCYATRHGAGPLEHEGEYEHGCTVEDPTNQPNQWQGALRSAPLDVDLTAKRIGQDFCEVLTLFPDALFCLVVTCCDQARSKDYAYHIKLRDPLETISQPGHLTGRLSCLARSYCLKHGHDTKGMRIILSDSPTREKTELLVDNRSSFAEEVSSVRKASV